MSTLTTKMRTDSLLAHCLTRATLLATAEPSKWDALKASPRGARVCAFLVEWAVVLEEQGVEELSIEDYWPVSSDSRATAYRRLADFRELFPEESDPNRIARALRDASRVRRSKPSGKVAVAL